MAGVWELEADEDAAMDDVPPAPACDELEELEELDEAEKVEHEAGPLPDGDDVDEVADVTGRWSGSCTPISSYGLITPCTPLSRI